MAPHKLNPKVTDQGWPAIATVSQFRNANPNYDPAKPCVYVGMTGLTPEKRFANHKKGHKASTFVKNYGVKLRPDLFERLNPMTRADAEKMEVTLTAALRKLGYAAWSN